MDINVLQWKDHIMQEMEMIQTKCIYSKFNTYACTDKIFYASSYRDFEIDKNEFYKKYKSEICA